MSSVVDERLRHWTCDPMVTGSIPALRYILGQEVYLNCISPPRGKMDACEVAWHNAWCTLSHLQ